MRRKAAGKEDRAWLERAYGYAAERLRAVDARAALGRDDRIVALLRFWKWPAPESVKDETGHYRQSRRFFWGSSRTSWRDYVVPQSRSKRLRALFALQVCDSGKDDGGSAASDFGHSWRQRSCCCPEKSRDLPVVPPFRPHAPPAPAHFQIVVARQSGRPGPSAARASTARNLSGRIAIRSLQPRAIFFSRAFCAS